MSGGFSSGKRVDHKSVNFDFSWQPKSEQIIVFFLLKLSFFCFKRPFKNVTSLRKNFKHLSLDTKRPNFWLLWQWKNIAQNAQVATGWFGRKWPKNWLVHKKNSFSRINWVYYWRLFCTTHKQYNVKMKFNCKHIYKR